MRDWSFADSAQASSEGSRLPRASAQHSNYTAASRGRRLRTWRVPHSGPNTAVIGELPLIRGRHRAAVRNDPWAGAAIEKNVANGIGVGIQAKMVNGTEALQKQSKRLWNEWMKVSDADGVLHFNGQQCLGWSEWDEGGECFVRRRDRRLTDGLPVPLQLQLIEGEQCPPDLDTIASNGNRVHAGIEFNAIGKRVAYWMYREHPGDMHFFASSNELVRIPADQIIHLYRPLRAGQIRGIPDAASTLVKAFNLESADDAVLERFKIANLFSVFFEQNIDPEDPEQSVEEQFKSDEEEELESGVDDTMLVGLEPGQGHELPPGYKATFSDPPTPGSDYSEFLRGHLLAIAARRGVPYEVLTGDLRNISDRALKLILNEFRRILEMKQWLFFIPQFCQRIRTWFFDAAFMAGALELDDYQARRDEIVETLWVPHGWPYSHPVQDVTADVKAIRAGLDSRTDTVLRRGEDPEEVDRKIAEDNRRADDLGLVLDSDPRRVSNAGLTQARAPGAEIPSAEIDDAGSGADDDQEEQERQNA